MEKQENELKKKIIEAKETLGERAASIIAEDLDIQNWDESSLKGCCPFHDESTPSFVWFSKNQTFKCFGCGKLYNIIDHYMYFRKKSFIEAATFLFNETKITYRFSEKGIKSERDYIYPKHDDENPEGMEKVRKYLNMRKISDQVLAYCDVSSDKNGNIGFNYYDKNDVLTMVKYRPSRKVEKGEHKMWNQVKDHSRPLLYNMNRIDPTKPLHISEGEIDTLSLIECGITNAVSVPQGANNYGWIEYNWEWLEQFDKIIVWSDNDDAGMKMRKEVVSRLGVWRTYFVDIPRTIEIEGVEKYVKDVNEVLYHCGPSCLLKLSEEIQEMGIAGVEDLSSVEEFDLESAEGLYSNISPLDKTFYKLLFGNVVIVAGSRGSGKSTLLNQVFVCESLNQGYDTFVFSGELSSSVLKNWIELPLAGPQNVQMKDGFIHKVSEETKSQIREWYKNRIWIYSQQDDFSADAILEKAVAVTRKNGVKVWLLDNLMTIDVDSKNAEELRNQKDFMVKLVRMARTYNVLIVLVIHFRKLQAGYETTADDVGGSGNLTNLASYIISVKRFTEKEKKGEMDGKGNYRKGKEPIEEDVAVSVMKNRFTGKTGESRLFFDYPSYRFYSNEAEQYKRYKWDKSTTPIKKNDYKAKDVPEFIGGE